MFDKIREAFALFAANLGLFASIVLTVRLPGNGLVNYLDVFVFDDTGMRTLQVNAGLEWIFGPLYTGALVFAAFGLLQGREVSYKDAMGIGLKNWFILWLAWLGAVLIIGIGLMLLVIPGIVLVVRYALIDSVVILDGPGPPVAWKRSNELTEGIRWQILGVGAVFAGGLIPLWLLFSTIVDGLFAAGLIGLLGKMVINTLVDCVQDMIVSVVPVVMLLFYLQQKREAE